MQPGFYGNAIFWVEVDKVKPNPFQPRKEFDEAKLRDLAASIRQYGVLQPLTVTRHEVHREDGGMSVEYELIAGERRLRASKLAGLPQVPVTIRVAEEGDRAKLELAIIENLQREDLNAIDRAKAFDRLVKEFNFKHTEIASRVGKSREYVANTLRILMLPEEMQQALGEGRIVEGHTRPLLMLSNRPEEQNTLFREIMLRKITVRDAEALARRQALDKVRKKEYLYSPEVLEMEKELSDKLGTRVMIETKEHGGKLTIDFFGEEDLRTLMGVLDRVLKDGEPVKLTPPPVPTLILASPDLMPPVPASLAGLSLAGDEVSAQLPVSETPEAVAAATLTEIPVEMLDDRTPEEIRQADENEFDPASFSI
jgi:ParB family chromosome partitioning protein